MLFFWSILCLLLPVRNKMNPKFYSLTWVVIIYVFLGHEISHAQQFDVSVDPIHWQTMIDNKWEKDPHPCQIKEHDSNQITKCEISVHGGFTRTYPKLSFKIETDKKLLKDFIKSFSLASKILGTNF